MLHVTLIALALVAATVSVHAVGMATLVSLYMHSEKRTSQSLRSITWLLIRTAWALILIHVIEITVWALFYLWQDCMPTAESAFYFSGVTYTTVGYGDLVLEQPWRMLGPVEGLTGILMCGLSGAFFFAVVSRVFSTHQKY